MNPRITDVRPGSDYTLILSFTNGEKRIFDVKPFLGTGLFRQLNDLKIFNTVRPLLGSIQWENGLDLCPDTLYLESVKIEIVESPASLHGMVAEEGEDYSPPPYA